MGISLVIFLVLLKSCVEAALLIQGGKHEEICKLNDLLWGHRCPIPRS